MNSIKEKLQIRHLGDSALIVQISNGISRAIHQKVINLVDMIEKNPFHGFIEAVPSYNNVTIHYDPVKVMLNYHNEQGQNAFEIVSSLINRYVERFDDQIQLYKRVVEVPVIYGEKYGPDLEYVASYNNLTPKQVIELHTKNEYLVHMIGFSPGFPYLGGMDKKLATPRKDSPRLSIPAGSVGIAGEQTGIYSFESPGGWQIIGQTPMELFTPEKKPPTLIRPGDIVQFVPITEDEFEKYKENHR